MANDKDMMHRFQYIACVTEGTPSNLLRKLGSNVPYTNFETRCNLTAKMLRDLLSNYPYFNINWLLTGKGSPVTDESVYLPMEYDENGVYQERKTRKI